MLRRDGNPTIHLFLEHGSFRPGGRWNKRLFRHSLRYFLNFHYFRFFFVPALELNFPVAYFRAHDHPPRNADKVGFRKFFSGAHIAVVIENFDAGFL